MAEENENTAPTPSENPAPVEPAEEKEEEGQEEEGADEAAPADQGQIA